MAFDYDEAFSRNIGWVSQQEQQTLREKRVAIAGMGGVGGDHAIRMARLGIANFTISDLDVFEQGNFNRQYGATMHTVGQPKIDVVRDLILGINPEADVRMYPAGVTEDNVDDFLAGADIYIDGLDFFELDIRRAVFRRCRTLGIPAVTAAPLGMGTALLVFTKDSMSFDRYFDFDSVDAWEDKMIKFLVGLSPAVLQRTYLSKDSAIDFASRKVPSTGLGISLAAGVACTTALQLLLERGGVVTAPSGLHFDAYRGKLAKTWRPGGNRNILQKIAFRIAKHVIASHAEPSSRL